MQNKHNLTVLNISSSNRTIIIVFNRVKTNNCSSLQHFMEMQTQIETKCKALYPNAMTVLEKIVFGTNVPKDSAFRIVDVFAING